MCQTDCYVTITEVWLHVLYGHNEEKIQTSIQSYEGRCSKVVRSVTYRNLDILKCNPLMSKLRKRLSKNIHI